MTAVTQTILHGQSERLGNCLSAAVATALDIPLDRVPHFVELGMAYGDKVDPEDTSTGSAWFAMMLGFFAGHGLWPVSVDSPSDAEPGEIVFVHGPSERGVTHQVLYRDGALWHDPHPSGVGLLSIAEEGLFVLRRLSGFDHSPGSKS